MREQPANQNGCSVSNGEAAPPAKRKKKKKWRSSSAHQRVSFRPPSHDPTGGHASLSCPGVSMVARKSPDSVPRPACVDAAGEPAAALGKQPQGQAAVLGEGEQWGKPPRVERDMGIAHGRTDDVGFGALRQCERASTPPCAHYPGRQPRIAVDRLDMHGRMNEPGLGVLMLPVSCRGKQLHGTSSRGMQRGMQLRGKQPDRLDAQQRHGVAWSHRGPRTTDSVFCGKRACDGRDAVHDEHLCTRALRRGSHVRSDVSCLHGHGRVTGNGIGARRTQTQQLQQLVAL